jgi:succinoglycan biosynthesis protein ExoO
MERIGGNVPESPNVSVVIAAWNAAATIENAISSALAQTGVSVEVIVVDDASPDDTAARVEAIIDPRLRLVRLAANRGPGGARNAGFAEAQGNWIAVLDSDDTMAPDRLTRMINRARQSGADVVIDNLEVRREAKAEPMFPAATMANPAPLVLPEFILSNVIFQSEFNLGYSKPLFSRKFVEAHGIAYDEGMSIGEDYLFLADCLASGAVCAREPSAGYHYYIRPGSISRKLVPAELEKIAAGDRRFLARHHLTGSAALAQHKRQRAMERATAFLHLVDAIKVRDIGKSLSILGADPSAARLLWMPVAARFRRLLGQT